MGNSHRIGRVGGLAVALGVGFAVAATPATGYAEATDSVACQAAESAQRDTTALVLGGTTVPTPDDTYIDTVKNHFIAPTHPGQDINNYCAVTAPMEAWPITGLGRLMWNAVGPDSVWGPGGPAWPDEPWWKLSGLFDRTFDQSIQAGAADLQTAMASYGNDHLVIFGYSQGAMVANVVKRKLAEQYPKGTEAPDIDFVLTGDPNIPNGGVAARFPGLYVPILDVSLNGPELTDTQFDTVVITRQYDGVADFPLYPLNVVADINAVLGLVYLHPYDLDVSLADETSAPIVSKDPGSDTTYYFFETPDLPLFAPLRAAGVPEPLIDVVEPFFREIVELGYDRTIPPWEPTPARLIPPLQPGKVAGDLLGALGEGVDNALAIIDGKVPLRPPVESVTPDRKLVMQQEFSASPGTLEGVGREVADGVAQLPTGAGALLPTHPALTRDGIGASQGKLGRVLRQTRDKIQQSIVGSADSAPKTTVRDGVRKIGSDVKKALTTTSRNLRKAMSGGSGNTDHAPDRGQ